ncbi:MAG TPA: sulfatase-like hydrolase/transferase [Pirellulaceae bacterium]|nr:sulfatase-like hydrolase/transferase [Pirellulaceae bacterium]
MYRKLSLFLLFIIGAVSPCLAQREAARSDGHRPNIVLLFADDLGYGELGCQGNPQIPTPHIDSIAKTGIRFTDGYVTAAYCSASRAGLMTGRYQTRFGYENNPTGHHNEDPRAGLPASEVTLAQHLHDAGYTTALFGKWHLGGHASFHPSRRGFDEFFGFMHEGHFFVPPPYRQVTTMLRRKALPDGRKGLGGGNDRWISEDGRLIYSTHMGSNEPAYDANNPILRGGQPVKETAYLTDALTREAVDFIDRSRDRPFFLYLAYNAVHSPLQGADAYMKRFGHIEDVHRRIFAAMLANLDDSVGEVLQALQECGLEENTLVFFVSDNGGPTRELTSSNLPLRGGKGDVFEGGIRVPFMVKWPRALSAGKTERRPVISLDIYATAAAVANAPIPDRRNIDGVNLIPFLTGLEAGRPHDVLFWRLNQKTAVRVGDWKLLKNPRRGFDANWHLYNLADDIGETRDLAAAQPKKRKEMTEQWDSLNRQMIDPIWSRRR